MGSPKLRIGPVIALLKTIPYGSEERNPERYAPAMIWGDKAGDMVEAHAACGHCMSINSGLRGIYAERPGLSGASEDVVSLYERSSQPRTYSWEFRYLFYSWTNLLPLVPFLG